MARVGAVCAGEIVVALRWGGSVIVGGWWYCIVVLLWWWYGILLWWVVGDLANGVGVNVGGGWMDSPRDFIGVYMCKLIYLRGFVRIGGCMSVGVVVGFITSVETESVGWRVFVDLNDGTGLCLEMIDVLQVVVERCNFLAVDFHGDLACVGRR